MNKVFEPAILETITNLKALVGEEKAIRYDARRKKLANDPDALLAFDLKKDPDVKKTNEALKRWWWEMNRIQSMSILPWHLPVAFLLRPRKLNELKPPLGRKI